MKNVRTELKRINENNSKLTDIVIFEESLISVQNKLYQDLIDYVSNKDNKNNKSTDETSVAWRRQTKETVSFRVKHYIDIEKIKNWIEDCIKNQKGLDVEYALRNFTRFDYENEEFIKFKEILELQESLVTRGFIDKVTIPNLTVFPIHQAKNEFNEKYYDEKKKQVLWQSKEVKEILNSEEKREQFIRKYFPDAWYLNEILAELLLRGNQILEISYEEVATNLNDKAREYLNNNWWQRNWRWCVTTIISISAFLISVTALILNIFKVI